MACGLGNTAAHRGMAGSRRHGLDRLHRLGVSTALLGVSLGFTTVALVAVRTLGLDGLVPELAAVTLANLAAAAFRFTILRTWVFRPRFGTHLGSAPGRAPRRPPSPVCFPSNRPPGSAPTRIPTRTSR